MTIKKKVYLSLYMAAVYLKIFLFQVTVEWVIDKESRMANLNNDKDSYHRPFQTLNVIFVLRYYNIFLQGDLTEF